MKNEKINPIISLDYPDPDVIRVGDTYYMVSTTMHFFPCCEILRSYDLVNWEHAVYVCDTLDNTPAQRLEEGNIYGQGMWAACIRYNNGKYYVCFSCNDTHKTYLYTTEDIYGKWEKSTIEGFYHDCSLLFDDDGRVYIVYGNREIWLTELSDDLSAPKKNGLHRRIVFDKDNKVLGYEGSHIYKINGRYYVFFIHSRPDRWLRCEACFSSDSLEGEFTGGDCLEDTMGYCGQGVAQGGIVDTPDGKWYAILFQDRGAVGRIPVLIPVSWDNDRPIFGENGKIPESFEIPTAKAGYCYAPLTSSDDFKGEKLSPCWQFNHQPDKEYYSLNPQKGCYRITSGRLCSDILHAKNTLTQRMTYPRCTAIVTINTKGLKNGETYKFLVRYTKSGRLSPTKYSGTISVKVYYKPIPKPTAAKNSIKLTWEAVPEAEKYAIYKYVDGKAVKLTETKKLSVKIGKLIPDTEYKYIVRTYVDGKWTTMLKSDIVTVKTTAE